MRIIKNLFSLNSVAVTSYFAFDMAKTYWHVDPLVCFVLLCAIAFGCLNLLEDIKWGPLA